MPLYEYSCEKCGKVFEVMQKMSEDPLTVHPECGGKVERLLSAPALHFKGSGFYITDYAKGSGTSNAPGKHPEGKHPEGKHADGKHSESKGSEGSKADGSTSESSKPDSSKPDSSKSGGSKSDSGSSSKSAPAAASSSSDSKS